MVSSLVNDKIFAGTQILEFKKRKSNGTMDQISVL